MVTKEQVKAKATKIKEEVRWKTKQTEVWIANHTDMIIAYTPVVVASLGFAGKAIKSGTRQMEIRNENRRHNMTVYDPSTGCYLTLKRPLKTKEKVALGNKPSFMTVTQVLDSFNVLK